MYLGNLVELADSDELYNNPVHPYTKSLLSAIPLPDPEYERNRKRIVYNPSIHDMSEEPEFREIRPIIGSAARGKNLSSIKRNWKKENNADKTRMPMQASLFLLLNITVSPNPSLVPLVPVLKIFRRKFSVFLS